VELSVRIGIGAQVGTMGGPATYARELVAALAAAGRHEYVVFTDEPAAFAASAVRTVHVPLRSVYHQLTWDHLRLPGLIAASGVALYHGTKNVLPWRLPVPGVVTVHDLAVYTHPDTFALPQRLHFRLTVPPSVRRAARIIAVSQHTRHDLESWLSVQAARVTVVPNGVAEAFHAPADPARVAYVRRRHGLGPSVIACVGTVQPRKRVERVIEAFAAAELAARGWQLVVAGRVRPGYRPPWIDTPPAGVVWLGTIPDADLPALYAAAAIAVSASEYEGFGLSVAEAMASGCAVIAVATSSVPEVAGDGALLIARSDSALLAGALRTLTADEGLRRALAERGRARAACFRWREAAVRTGAVYDEVVRCANV
jgi:glycosyltransferase involved in cell wall biosynthesis